MLVLTRKVGDVIAIGDDVKIVVMSIRGKQVRLGIQASKDTVVHREEVYQKIQQEIREAMKNDVVDAQVASDLLRAAQFSSTDKDKDTPKKEMSDQVSSSRRSGVKIRD